MRKSILTLFLLFCLAFNITNAQDLKVDIGAYIDAYIASDNNRSDDSLNSMRLFSYINPRKNQFAFNTAQVSAKISIPDKVRGILTLHTGDLHKTGWVNANVSMPLIQQANAGFRVYDNFWMDAGLFLTHIGGESLLPKDNWLSTHSLVTYYEPFYQVGVRASYETEKFTAQLHLLNGNGLFDENNYNKTFGWFLSYTPSGLFSVSYAGVIGNEEPGSPANARTHMLHNLVAQVNPIEDLSFKGQFDYASRDVASESNPDSFIAGSYLGFSLTAHYQFTKEFSTTARFAFVNNSDGVYSPVAIGKDLSLGAEYKPSVNSFIRLEGRSLIFDDKYKFFNNGSSATGQRMEVILNMGLWLN